MTTIVPKFLHNDFTHGEGYPGFRVPYEEKSGKPPMDPLPAPSGLGVVKMNVNGERKNGSEGAAVDYSPD